MTNGYFFLALAIVGYALLGVFHKLADHELCRPKFIALILRFWGAVLTTLYAVIFDSKGLDFPRSVVWVGAVAGVFASLALFTFQAGLKHGKISTSWLVLNLSTSIPILISIFIYHERVNVMKLVGLMLVLLAILGLWLDKKKDLSIAKAEKQHSAAEIASQWVPLMILAFLANGIAGSTQKILVEVGGGDYPWQFLIVLYASGFAFLTLLSVNSRVLPNRREWVTAFAMAVASVTANLALVLALRTVPGSIGYPIGNGGSLVLVVLAGVLFFRERLNAAGKLGVTAGIAAIVALALA